MREGRFRQGGMASADNGLPAGSRADSFSGGGGDAIEEVGPELGDLYQEALLLVSRLHPDMAAPLVDAVSHDSPLAGMLRRHGTGQVPHPPRSIHWLPIRPLCTCTPELSLTERETFA